LSPCERPPVNAALIIVEGVCFACTQLAMV